ncbi:PREDICTED: uncharacterized protein LOC108782813, partial [Cyphomyrmex costatus]|uniref:uncharacterized protein LOC108782813 n=1 Tax=Cyphomyrmex costatus TaxID=456900 RepID=UPI0008522C48
ADTREAWEIKLGPSTSYPTWKEFEEFVTGHSRAWESLASASSQPMKEKGRLSYSKGKPDAKARSLVAIAPSSKGSVECPVCKSSHFLSNCPKYLSQPLERRKRTAIKLDLCFNCLGKHFISRCQKASPSDQIERVVSQKPITLLATCQVQIGTCDGDFVIARALLDPGSELSFITENLVHRLRLTRKAASIPLLGIGGTYSGRTKGFVDIVLHSLLDTADSYALQAFILPRLTFEIPSSSVTSTSWTHLKDLPLADPHFSKPGLIHIIIGADHYGQIIKPELRKGEPSSPIAQLTLFGWIVYGPVAPGISERGSYHCHVDRDLQNLLTCFWKQEDIPKTVEKFLNSDEADCEAHFRSTVSRDSSGRYIVRLPLKSPATLLGDSTAIAFRCLSRLLKRLEREPSYSKLYTEFLHEYQTLGHMISVPESEVDASPVFYLPHHGVMRENSQTTKLRVVFNGSSPTSNGLSLNDILHTGAKLQTNIFDVLLRFRSHQYVFSSDITKMYRNILVHADDQNLQRILWHDSNGKLRSYKLTTVTYGLNCAPFLALRVIQQLIDDEGHRFPKAIPSLSRERYVDDIFGGADSLDEIQEVMTQVHQLCMAGGFPLQKWSSNCPSLLDHLSSSQSVHTAAVELESSGIKILGLSWQPKTDDFRFTSLPPTARNVTKRSVLSEIAQLYDPLGLIAPVVVRAKIFIQELWLAKVDWDTPLSLELQHRWIKYKQQLPELVSLNIPRWLHISSITRSIQLHGFSDASQLAMAAVVFLRVETENSEIQISIVCARTKVAPLKKLTVPRLELNAALLLSRLISSVQSILELSDSSIFLWTDSSVTLTWISSHPAKWKEYVRNRVTAIKDKVPSASWGFVPGKENPADCASRGLNVNEIKQHPLWWHGPSWLREAPVQWPRLTPTSTTEIDMEESSGYVFTSVRDQEIPSWDLLERYSSLTKLIRVTAICLRAVRRFKQLPAESSTEHLSPLELQESCHFWIRKIQQFHFQQEMGILSRRGRLSKSSHLIKLTPFIDKSGIMRVGGRLQQAGLEHDTTHPIILPRR